MKFTVLLPAVLFLGIFGVAAPQTVEEDIEETMADAEEDVQAVIDKYTKKLAEIEAQNGELEAKRAKELAELVARHEREWFEYDDDCNDDKLKLAADCDEHPDECAMYTADLKLEHEEKYNSLLDKLTDEKNDFEIDFFTKCSALERNAKVVMEEMAEQISKIYLERDEEIADYMTDDEAEKVKIFEDQEKRADELHAEFRAKVNQFTQELREPLCFELAGVERLMTSEEIVTFDREVLRAMRYLMQKEGIDCDVHELFGTVNYGLDEISLGRKLIKRLSRTISDASFNIKATCSTCESCQCLPLEGHRRALHDERTSDRRILEGDLKDKLSNSLSQSSKLREVFPELEEVIRIKCPDNREDEEKVES